MPSNVRRAPSETKTVHRLSRFRPGTINVDERSAWVVAATETPVSRFFGDEILRCDQASVVATRLNGMPFIDSHDRSSIMSVLGQVVETKFENRTLLAKVVFAESERGEAAFKLVQQGMLNKVSVGYRIHEADETRGRNGGIVTTATRWEPYELSLVSVPADPNANIRGKMTMAKKAAQGMQGADQTAFDDEDDQFDDNVRDLDDNGDGAPPRPISISGNIQQLAGIRRGAMAAGVSEREFDEATHNCRSLNDLRRVAFDLMARQQVPTFNDWQAPGRDNVHGERAIVDALAVRLGATSTMPSNPLTGRSVAALGRAWMTQNNIRSGHADDAQVIDTVITYPDGRIELIGEAGVPEVSAVAETSPFEKWKAENANKN